MSSLTLRPLRLGPLPKNPLVSVLIANYNYENYIGEALRSLKQQTYPRFEAIVCDDGSTDFSLENIRSFSESDPRIQVIAKENGGVASALNAAFTRSKGDIICLLDADDSYCSNKLESTVSAFLENPWGLVVHPMTVIDGAGRPIQRKPAFGRLQNGWIAEDVVRQAGRWSYMEASAVSLRREIAAHLFPIPEDRFRTWADAYLCVGASLLTPVGSVDDPLALYRLHSSNTSGFSAVSLRQATGAMDGVSRVVAGVSERLSDVLGQPLEIEVAHNLIYLESDLLASLLGGDRARASGRKYARYASAVRGDKIYGAARKLLSLFFLGTALLMPRSWRSAWITAGLTESRAKERIRRGLELLRSLSRTRRASSGRLAGEPSGDPTR